MILRIVVRGNERIEQGTVLSYLPIQLGETVDPQRLDWALKTLARTDLFADVKIELQSGELVVKVVENPIINQVVFEGNSALKEDKLKDELQIRPRGIFTRSKVQADVQRIIELYRRSGRISATVTPKVVELPQKRIDLVFEINEGPKSGVLGVNFLREARPVFLGNIEFSENELSAALESGEGGATESKNCDNIRQFYRSHGFFDINVKYVAPDGVNENVSYFIIEGPKYKIGNIVIDTKLKGLDGHYLAQILPIHSGQEWSRERLERSVDALIFMVGAKGFSSVDVRWRHLLNREVGVVDVVFVMRLASRASSQPIEDVNALFMTDGNSAGDSEIEFSASLREVLLGKPNLDHGLLNFNSSLNVIRRDLSDKSTFHDDYSSDIDRERPVFDVIAAINSASLGSKIFVKGDLLRKIHLRNIHFNIELDKEYESLWHGYDIGKNSPVRSIEDFENSVRNLYVLARRENSSAVLDYIESEFSDVIEGMSGAAERIDLPSDAPAWWGADKLTGRESDRVSGETPPEFIKKHYGQWLGMGLTRAHLRVLDPQLYTALANWLRNNEMPPDVDLPTPRQVTDRWVDRVVAVGEADPRTFERVAKALRTRGVQ